MDEITSSFEERHNQLIETEKGLKAELDLKVTEVKNELENFLIESNDIILSCERTDKANKYYEKKNDNKEIKSLYYISAINKINEKAKTILQKPIRNLDIYFNSELNSLDYENYYFSGIPIPKNIKAERQKNKTLLSWDIDDFRIKDYDIKDIKYNIKIKVNDETSTYESLNTNITLDNDLFDIEFEVKIRASIDDCFGNWSKIKKFKKEEPKRKNENTNIFGASSIFVNNNQNSFNFFQNNNQNKSSFYEKTNSISIFGGSLFSNSKK